VSCLKKSPENYKHSQGHLNKGDAPLLRKTAGESTSHFLGIGQEIPSAGRKEYPSFLVNHIYIGCF